jgi:ankyrin repeat protein
VIKLDISSLNNNKKEEKMFEKNPLTPLEKEFVELLKIGDYRDLYFLVVHEKVDPNCIFKTKNTIIKIFSNSYASQLVSFLKKQKLDLNKKDLDGIGLLQIALGQRDISLFKKLLELGADPNVKTSEKISILSLAIDYAIVTKKFFGIEFVEELLGYGAKYPFKSFIERIFKRRFKKIASLLCKWAYFKKRYIC